MTTNKQLQEPVAWLYEDELPDSYPYETMFPYSKVDGVRMFPVYAPQPTPDVSALVEALEWYSEQVLGCRKITSEGEQYRAALDRDGGARARAALASYRSQGGEA